MESAGPANATGVSPNQATWRLVTVYGTSWCAATQDVRGHLVRLGVRYRYVALDQSPETLTQLKRLAIDRAIHPTVSVGSEMLVEPSLGELDWALLRQGML